MIGLHDIKIVREKAIELQAQILTAQSSALAAQSDQFALLEKVRSLEQQITDLEAWDREKKRYELKAIDSGSFAYVLKPDASNSEPPHWLCTTCYQNGKKSILQVLVSPMHSMANRVWTCPVCSTRIQPPWHLNPAGDSQSPT
jgi:hypothetical protein